MAMRCFITVTNFIKFTFLIYLTVFESYVHVFESTINGHFTRISDFFS